MGYCCVVAMFLALGIQNSEPKPCNEASAVLAPHDGGLEDSGDDGVRKAPVPQCVPNALPHEDLTTDSSSPRAGRPASSRSHQKNVIDAGNEDLLHAFERASVPATFSSGLTWQGADRCGLNCLYAFVTMLGAGVSYDRLEEIAAPVPNGGYSMAQLQDIAQRAGVPVNVIRGDPAQIKTMDPPVILHLGEPNKPGHFICFVHRSGDSQIFVDGTTGGQFTVGENGTHALAGVLRAASGYMLVPATQPRYARAWIWLLRGTAGAALALACIFIGLASLRARARRAAVMKLPC